MTRIDQLQETIAPFHEKLQNHSLYQHIKSIDDVKTFMEGHVYAVWDFMSLLKALQNTLTCTTVPWKPVEDSETARFINEIVHGEETDVNEKGEVKSHFEMYLEAMQELGADWQQILKFTGSITAKNPILTVIDEASLPEGIKKFLNYTFEVIDTQQPHIIASAFTFGREDVIPDMFLEILNESKKNGISGEKLKYYLERHIELDGDEHGPLSLRMIENLCGDDEQKWKEVEKTAIDAMKMRVELWNHLEQMILEKCNA